MKHESLIKVVDGSSGTRYLSNAFGFAIGAALMTALFLVLGLIKGSWTLIFAVGIPVALIVAITSRMLNQRASIIETLQKQTSEWSDGVRSAIDLYNEFKKTDQMTRCNAPSYSTFVSYEDDGQQCMMPYDIPSLEDNGRVPFDEATEIPDFEELIMNRLKKWGNDQT